MKRVLTGARSSGTPHIGNYLGAFLPALKLGREHELFFFLADLHSLNTQPSPEELRGNSLKLLASLIASGMRPENTTLYCQSMVPEISEISWHLGCWAPFGQMQRSVAYKDAVAKGAEVNMGIFNYPILMAADILSFQANLVPVGKDQKQHLEITRDLAQKWNAHYGEVLVEPEPLISEDVGVIPGIDGNKMSKSTGNVIPLYGTDKQWKKSVMAIVTSSEGLEDPKDPDNCHVFQLFKFFANQEEQLELREKYVKGGYGFGHAKLDLLNKIKENFSTQRDEYFELLARPDDMLDIVRTGSAKARQVASEVLDNMKSKCGLLS